MAHSGQSTRNVLANERVQVIIVGRLVHTLEVAVGDGAAHSVTPLMGLVIDGLLCSLEFREHYVA